MIDRVNTMNNRRDNKLHRQLSICTALICATESIHVPVCRVPSGRRQGRLCLIQISHTCPIGIHMVGIVSPDFFGKER